MAEYLVTYDLEKTEPDPYEEFVLAAEKQGLLYVYRTEEVLQRLTNTTLWGEFSDKVAVRDAFDRARVAAEKKLGARIVLERRVIPGFVNAYVRSDRKKRLEARWTGAADFATCRRHQVGDPFFAY